MLRARLATIHIGLPLALGAMSYLAFRSWVPILGSHTALWPSAPALLRHHTADALWGWALGAFVTVMWLGEDRKHRLAWTAGAVGLAASMELFQAAACGWGAFDRIDLVVQTGAVLLAALVIGGTWQRGCEAR